MVLDSFHVANTVLENSSESIVFIDTHFNVVQFNTHAKNRLHHNLNKEIAVGVDFRDYLYAGFETDFYTGFVKALEGISTNAEVNLEDSNIYIKVKFSPVLNLKQEVQAVCMMVENKEKEKKTEHSLRQSEDKFQKIINSAVNAVIIVDQSMKIQLANPEAEELFGYTFEELLGNSIHILIPDRFKKGHVHKERKFLASGNPIRMGNNRYIPAKKKNGEEIIIDASLNTFQDNKENYVLIIIQDVTQRLQSEEKLIKINHELKLLNKINDAILTIKNETVLLDEICKEIVETGQYKLAWIGKEVSLFEESKMKYLAKYGNIEYLNEISISITDWKHLNGPSLSAIRDQKTIITNNVINSADFEPWAEKAKKHGIAASIALPITFDNNIKGCLHIYSEKMDAFDENEIIILTRLCNNLSLAIKNIRTSEKEIKTQLRLNKRVKELGLIYSVNAFLQTTHFSEDEALLRIVALIPEGWQFKNNCEAKIYYDDKEFSTPNYRPSKIMQSVNFKTKNDKKGTIEVVYLTSDDTEELEFIAEEFDLIKTLAEMITIHFNKSVAFNELKISEANLNSVFDNTDVGHILLDINMNILSFNTTLAIAYERITGIEMKKNSSFFSFLINDKKNNVEAIFKKVFETKKQVVYDSVYYTKQKELYFNIRISPILEKSKIIGYCLSAIDITNRKRIEIERQNIITDLIQKNRDLEQFTYIVSHNLRSPLSNIIGLSNLLKEELIKNEELIEINGIYESALSLESTIQDLNEILQLKTAISERKTTIVLSEMIEYIKQIIKPLLIEKNVVINCDFSKINELISIKPYIQNIFYNLISNSIKYARPNVAPEITIWSEIKEKAICIHVEDNGKGIDLEKNGNKIFGLYKRFDLSVAGKGLGLYMVKTEIEALHGTIAVESKLGQGSHFILTFKLNDKTGALKS